MDGMDLLLIGVGGLVLAGALALVLRRMWGGSLDRQPTYIPPNITISDHTLRQVQALAAAGNKIQAIKLLRDLTGLGLKEAKDYVEALPPGPAQPPDDRFAPVLPPQAGRELTGSELGELLALLGTGNKIAAIKLYRELTGVGLKEAKDFVDTLPTSGSFGPRTGAPGTGTPIRALTPEELAEIRGMAAAGDKILAIKRYRELTGLGLKEAKDYVEGL